MNTRQPRRTRAQWAEIIERQSQSGQTIRDFCKDNDVGLASFGKWKKKLIGGISTDSGSSSESMFQSVSIREPVKAMQTSSDGTIVTLSLGSNMTLTIQTNEPAR